MCFLHWSHHRELKYSGLLSNNIVGFVPSLIHLLVATIFTPTGSDIVALYAYHNVTQHHHKLSNIQSLLHTREVNIELFKLLYDYSSFRFRSSGISYFFHTIPEIRRSAHS